MIEPTCLEYITYILNNSELQRLTHRGTILIYVAGLGTGTYEAYDMPIEYSVYCDEYRACMVHTSYELEQFVYHLDC